MNKLIKPIYLISFSLYSLNIFAQTDPFLGLECDGKKIKIEYELIETSTPAHESKEQLSKNGSIDYWRLRDLRTIKETKDEYGWKAWVESSKTILKECQINKKSYQISINEISGNPRNLYGHCGGWLTALVKIKDGDKTVLNIKFEDGCEGKTIIPLVEYYGDKPPIVKKIDLADYYQ